ncbi:MAG TPA: transporter substrate-binding domain-containing protein, partial [Methanofollis liminatans]|nr:transporter substrate-binding domain-containing protein [Methanofollis liminatans]
MSPSRRYTYFFLIAVLTGALALAAGCLSAPEEAPGDLNNATPAALTYYTEDLPPYNYLEDGTLQGISVDLLEAITERIGEKVSRDAIRLVAWAEGYEAALTQNATVLFTMARTPEREMSFKWVGPISTDRYVLFAGRDRAVAGPDDLKDYRIGVIAGDIAGQQLLDLGVTPDRLVEKTNVSAIIAGLESGEIDLWCYPEAGGRRFAEEATGNAYTYAVVFTLQDLDNYYAFSRDVPDETVRSFQQALDALKQERDAAGISPYERILGRYVPSIGLAHLAYLTEEWAPFNYEKDGKAAGISVEILEAVFSHIGVNRTGSDVRIVPLAEGLQAAQNDTGTVLFSLARTPEREPLYQWAGPFTSTRFVLFAPTGRNITIAAPGDLDRYRIGAVEESVEKDFLLALGVNASGMVVGETLKDLLSMLEEDRIDLWATGELAGRHQMMQAGEGPEVYEAVYTLGESGLYY